VKLASDGFASPTGLGLLDITLAPRLASDGYASPTPKSEAQKVIINPKFSIKAGCRPAPHQPGVKPQVPRPPNQQAVSLHDP